MLRFLRPHPADLPESPLRGLRAGTLALALLSLAAVVPPALMDAGTPLALRLCSPLVALVLAAHWVAGYRRRSFAAAAEVPEALAILLLLHLCPGDAFLPLFALLFRSLYGSVATAALRGAMYIAIIFGDHAIKGHPAVGPDTGKSVGIVLAGWLMQSLRHALRRFERSERRLRSLVQNSTDVVTILDQDGVIRWQAASIHEVFGLDPDALIGTPIADVVDPEDAPTLQRALERTLPGASRTVSVRIRAADGSLRDVEAVTANRTQDPSVEGFVVTLRDATDRRRLEIERATLAAQRAEDAASRRELELLRERVDAQREKQELEARLQRSQRLESVGQLAGGVAHDFNNLLAVILNYAAFVREELPPGLDLHADLEEIERAAERGARLTRQLLLFSQRKATDPEVLDLNAVVANLQRLLRRSVSEHVAIRFEHGEALWPVEVDLGSVEQVLVNLVVNARDALPRGGNVAVSTANVELDAEAAGICGVAPGRYVRLAVTDDGEGMAADTIVSALDPFFTTKPPGEGTGLGLATVDGIAGRAGGCVTIQSELGAGTSVHVYLPATEKPAPAVDVRAPAPAPRQGGERVLVVEDEVAVRSMIERILLRAGYDVATASSGDDALAHLGVLETPPDLVLTDMVMPGISGWELAQSVRARHPAQRVVFMSGYSDQLLRRHGPAPAEVLSKPFAADVLLAHVRRVLDDVPSAAAADARKAA